MINPNATGSTWILFLRLASAFMTFSSAISVGQTGHIRFLRPFKKYSKKLWQCIWRHCMDPLSKEGLQMAKYNIETRYADFVHHFTIVAVTGQDRTYLNLSWLILAVLMVLCILNHSWGIIYITETYTILTTQITLALLTILPPWPPNQQGMPCPSWTKPLWFFYLPSFLLINLSKVCSCRGDGGIWDLIDSVSGNARFQLHHVTKMFTFVCK